MSTLVTLVCDLCKAQKLTTYRYVAHATRPEIKNDAVVLNDDEPRALVLERLDLCHACAARVEKALNDEVGECRRIVTEEAST